MLRMIMNATWKTCNKNCEQSAQMRVRCAHLERPGNIDDINEIFLKAGAWQGHEHVSLELRFKKYKEIEAHEKDPQKQPV